MLLREFLPSRSSEDILAERVRLRLGGEEYILPVLSIDETEAWQAKFASDLAVVFSNIEASSDAAHVMARLMTLGPIQLGLIRGFDRDGLLPDDATLKRTTSPSALLKAFVEVLAAAHPTVGVLLDAVVREPAILVELLKRGEEPPSPTPLRKPSSGQPPNTGGRPASSAVA